MGAKEIREFKVYKGECMSIAIDFHYPDSVLKAIRNAENEAQLSNIMLSAAREKLK